MKHQQILGNRLLVKPLDLIKKKKGEIILPQVGATITSSPCYQAEVLMVGDGPSCKARPDIALGIRILLMKGGALDLEDGTRIIALDDAISIIDPSEPQPE